MKINHVPCLVDTSQWLALPDPKTKRGHCTVMHFRLFRQVNF